TGSGNDNQATATITVSLINPAPSEGCTMNFTVEPVNNSGGHSHIGSRPRGTLSDSTISLYNWEPEKTAIYTSSEVSGEERIIAEVTGGGKGEISIMVRVPDLQPMPVSGEGHWRLTGFRGTHPDNHYGTPSTKARIAAMARDYFELYTESTGVNDMSLELGGLFDVNGNWSSNPGHIMHRIGKSVDVDRCAQTLVKQNKLDSIAKKYSGTRIKEKPLMPPPCEGPVDTLRIHYEFP
ncbi:MAG: hypothetical protein AABX37_00600, partial [Nanoarchaeota archaeon]